MILAYAIFANIVLKNSDTFLFYKFPTQFIQQWHNTATEFTAWNI